MHCVGMYRHTNINININTKKTTKLTVVRPNCLFSALHYNIMELFLLMHQHVITFKGACQSESHSKTFILIEFYLH